MAEVKNALEVANQKMNSQVDVKIDKNDIIETIMYEREEVLRADLLKLNTDITSLRQAAADISDTLVSEALKEVKEISVKKINAYLVASEAVGMIERNKDGKFPKYLSPRVTIDYEKSEVVYNFQGRMGNGKNFSFPIKGKAKDAMEKYTKIRSRLTAANTDYQNISKEMGNQPQFKRAIRAHFTKSILKNQNVFNALLDGTITESGIKKLAEVNGKKK